MHYEVFSNSLGLFPLDASSTALPFSVRTNHSVLDIAKYHQVDKVASYLNRIGKNMASQCEHP